MAAPIRHIYVEKTQSEEAFIRFVRERQSITDKRARGLPPPWTDDQLLQRYRFTNINRRLDRGAKFYLEHVVSKSMSRVDLVFNTFVYRLVNKPSTFELHGRFTAAEYRWQDFFKPVNKQWLSSGEAVFTGAFQTTPKFHGIDAGSKIKNYALLFERLADLCIEHGKELLDQQTMIRATKMLLKWPGMGSFIAPQIVCDLAYDRRSRFDERDAVELDRGGSRWAMSDIYGQEPLAKHQERFEALAVRAQLTPLECENALCEFSKYVRLSDGRSAGSARRFHARIDD